MEIYVKYYQGKFDAYQRTYVLDNFKNSFGKFIFYKVEQALENITKNNQGSSVKFIKKGDLENYKFLLPPLAEQKKIAEVLGSVDKNIEKTEEIILKTEELKKGLMQKLFSDKLEVKSEKLMMRDICKVRQGLQIPINKRLNEQKENSHVYLTIKYLKDLENPEYIENPQKSVVCKEDDVLMTRTGNTGVVITGVKGVFHNNFFLVDYDRKKVDRDFLVYYLRSAKVQKMILDRAGTTTIPDLNHGDFYSIPFLKPNLQEQKKIAEILSAVDDKINIYKQVKNKLTTLKKGLMQDLLSGEVRV